MTEKANQFKQEMVQLLTKYGATYSCAEYYDQDEQPEGATDYVEVDGQLFTLADFDVLDKY